MTTVMNANTDKREVFIRKSEDKLKKQFVQMEERILNHIRKVVFTLKQEINNKLLRMQKNVKENTEKSTQIQDHYKKLLAFQEAKDYALDRAGKRTETLEVESRASNFRFLFLPESFGKTDLENFKTESDIPEIDPIFRINSRTASRKKAPLRHLLNLYIKKPRDFI